MAQDSFLREFSGSLREVKEYPMNLVFTDTSSHRLHSYFTRLNEAEGRLCCEDGKAQLGFWTCEDQDRNFECHYVENMEKLRDFYKIDPDFAPGVKDLRCSFAFIRAPNSRERLLISRPMLSLLFTYHRVLPAFLDFVLIFGRRERGPELYYGKFCSESRLFDSSNGLRIPEMARSRSCFRFCYTLVSMERSPRQEDWPWSVQQTAIHHSFDIVTGRASWIIVEGDNLIEERVKKATDPSSQTDTACFQTNSSSFVSSLNTHLVYIEWSEENWHSYINYLEDEAQNTRRVLFADVDNIPKSMAAAAAAVSSPMVSKRTSSGLSSPFPEKDSQFPSKWFRPWAKISGKLRQRATTRDHTQQQEVNSTDDNGESGFCFADLQRAQYLEEKTNVAILVININLGVIGDMKRFYQELLNTDESFHELSVNCTKDIERFLRRTSSAENFLQVQKNRARSLAQVLADRKKLLFGVLEYHMMEASRVLAQSMHGSGSMHNRQRYLWE